MNCSIQGARFERCDTQLNLCHDEFEFLMAVGLWIGVLHTIWSRSVSGVAAVRIVSVAMTGGFAAASNIKDFTYLAGGNVFLSRH